MLISGCVVVLFTVRMVMLLAAVCYPRTVSGRPVTVFGHIILIAASIADFVDVGLMVLALLLLLRYNYVVLPKLQLHPDPQVRPLTHITACVY